MRYFSVRRLIVAAFLRLLANSKLSLPQKFCIDVSLEIFSKLPWLLNLFLVQRKYLKKRLRFLRFAGFFFLHPQSASRKQISPDIRISIVNKFQSCWAAQYSTKKVFSLECCLFKTRWGVSLIHFFEERGVTRYS